MPAISLWNKTALSVTGIRKGILGYYLITDTIGAKKYSVMSRDDTKKGQSNTRTSMNEGLQG